MPSFTFKATVTKVGNSFMLALPKPLCELYGIERGDTVSLIATDKGVYMPQTPKKDNETRKSEKAVEEIERSAK